VSGAKRLLVPWYRFPPFRETGIGGLSVVMWELTRALARGGLSVDVVTPAQSGVDPVQELDGVKVVRSQLGDRLKRGASLGGDDRRLLSEYDAILSIANFGARSLRKSPELLRLAKRQVHMVAHDRPVASYLSVQPSPFEQIRMRYRRMRDRSEEVALKGTTTMCVSKYLLEVMAASGLETRENLSVVPNGVDAEAFRPIPKEKEFDLVFVGRYQLAKGLDILTDALGILRSRGQHPTLAVVGQFSDAERLDVQSRTPEDLRPRISFLGTIARQSMPGVLNSARVVVVPSRYETFGMPALEAISCGLPVVATSVGGLPELVDRRLGVLALPNPPALADAVATCLKDEPLHESARVNGPATAAGYDWRIVAAKAKERISL
jgi:D-inositol-3-phosphate glycosyltransferase